MNHLGGGSLRALVLVLALSGFGALAQPNDAERYITAASRLYEDLEYERALQQLQSARRISRSVEHDVAIALYEGVILADMGKKEESVAAFKAGLFLKPDAKLPVKVSPKVEREFEAIRADVKKELAPILAKQEAERRAREQAEAKARADEERKAREDSERKAREEKARAESERKAREEAERRAREQASQSAQVTPRDATDRPTAETKVIDARPAERPDAVDASAAAKVEQARGVPVMPLVFGGLGVAAAGVGGYFGLQSRGSVDAAREARFEDETRSHLAQAQGSANVANVLFGVAAAAGVASLTSYLISAGEDAATASGGQP